MLKEVLLPREKERKHLHNSEFHQEFAKAFKKHRRLLQTNHKGGSALPGNEHKTEDVVMKRTTLSARSQSGTTGSHRFWTCAFLMGNTEKWNAFLADLNLSFPEWMRIVQPRVDPKEERKDKKTFPQEIQERKSFVGWMHFCTKKLHLFW